MRERVHDQGEQQGISIGDHDLGKQEQDQIGRQQQESREDEPHRDAQEEAEEGVQLGVGVLVDLHDQQVADRAETEEDRQGHDQEEPHREHHAAREAFVVALHTHGPEHVERDHSLT